MDELADDPIAARTLDGNAVAGLLYEWFGREMTHLPGQCDHCGNEAALATLRAYLDAPGAVLRCSVCEGVVIRIVQRPDGLLLDARGLRHLYIARG